MVENGCKILKYLNKKYKRDPKIVYESLKLDITQIKYVDIKILNELSKQNFDLEKTFKSLS